jgi:hypothetical protein
VTFANGARVSAPALCNPLPKLLRLAVSEASIRPDVAPDPATYAELSCRVAKDWARRDGGKVEPALAGAALLAENALESLSWDASVVGEVDAAFPNSKRIAREKSHDDWLGVEICALALIGS